MNSNFLKENIHMVKNHILKNYASIITREMQIRIRGYLLTSVTMYTSQKQSSVNVDVQ